MTCMPRRVVVPLALAAIALVSWTTPAAARKPTRGQLPDVLRLAESVDGAAQELYGLAKARATDADNDLMGNLEKLANRATHFHRILNEAQGDENGAHTQKAFWELKERWDKTTDAWGGSRVKGSDSTAKQFKRVRKLVDSIQPYYDDSLPAPGED